MKEISFKEMAKMADDGLIDAIRETIRQVTSSRDLTISSVELSLAIVLAAEIEQSCSTEAEIRVQCSAYAKFIAGFAFYALTTKGAPAGASVN